MFYPPVNTKLCNTPKSFLLVNLILFIALIWNDLYAIRKGDWSYFPANMWQCTTQLFMTEKEMLINYQMLTI